VTGRPKAPLVERTPPVILEPRSVKVSLAAAALGISERSAWDEVKSGRLRSFRYGTRVLVPVAALDEWLKARDRVLAREALIKWTEEQFARMRADDEVRRLTRQVELLQLDVDIVTAYAAGLEQELRARGRHPSMGDGE
jgi:excisionase family DNA binding protein